MKVVLFCHSLLSDWNHGNAHFLRGVATELVSRGHEVRVFEPLDSWSATNLVQEIGALPTRELEHFYPALEIERYDLRTLDLERATDAASLVLVHEWNDPALVAELGALRSRSRGWELFFHDTHHRSVSDATSVASLDLEGYDGVLAFGEAVRERYVAAGWVRHAFTWHEAADIRIFRPPSAPRKLGPERDLVFVGNFGDDERTRELEEFLLEPVRALRISASAFGVRYPESCRAALARAGIAFGGYAPNYRVPEIFARHRVTVHVPRAPYTRALPGVPTIRVFEALACGIPLISAPWSDSEGLFGRNDFLRVKDGAGMRTALRDLICDPALRDELGARGLATIHARHTCAHRVDELLRIWQAVRGAPVASVRPEPGLGAEAV